MCVCVCVCVCVRGFDILLGGIFQNLAYRGGVVVFVVFINTKSEPLLKMAPVKIYYFRILRNTSFRSFYHRFILSKLEVDVKIYVLGFGAIFIYRPLS